MQPVFVTQLVDRDHPVLGFVVGWINALAARCHSVVVIANEVGSRRGVAGNVRVVSLGKESGAGRVERAARFERAIWSAARGPGAAVLVHMVPAYVNLAAPIARLRRVPLLLWFAHPSDTPSLRAADRMCDVVLTSLPGAYPRPGGKVRVIGQAIDVEELRPAPLGRSSKLRVVAIGRTSPAKGFDVIICAIARMRGEGVAVTGRIVGPSTTPLERRHRDELAELRGQLGLDGIVRIDDGVAPAEVPRVMTEADVLANAMVSGSGDKVVFEAAALGRIPVVSNPAFSELLGELPLALRFRERDHEELADRLGALAAADPLLKEKTAAELRRRIEAGHSLDHWADAVLDAMQRSASGLRVS